MNDQSYVFVDNNATDWNETELIPTAYRLKQVYLPLHGYLSFVVCIFGIVTNIANIIVLTRWVWKRHKKKNHFFFFFISLSH